MTGQLDTRTSGESGSRGATVQHLAARDATRIAWRVQEATERQKGRERGSVVLTNGLSTTDEFWHPLMNGLAADYRVIDWWYRGHGESESARTNDYALSTHADDLLRVTEAAGASGVDGRPAVHVAFSMGVTVLLELYRARPDLVRAMVLVAGGADHPHASNPIFRIPGARAAFKGGLRAAAPLLPAVSPIARRVGASRALFPVARALGAIGRDAPREEIERFFRSVGAMDLRAWTGTVRSLLDQRASEVLPTVRVPVLIVAPEHDVLAPQAELEALRDAIPNAAWMKIPHTSHAVLLEAGDKIAARVKVFLGSLP